MSSPERLREIADWINMMRGDPADVNALRAGADELDAMKEWIRKRGSDKGLYPGCCIECGHDGGHHTDNCQRGKWLKEETP